MCCSYRSFKVTYYTGSQILYFYLICFWSPISSCDKILAETYKEKHVIFTCETPEEFFKYLLRFAIHCLKLKVSRNFWPYSVCIFNPKKKYFFVTKSIKIEISA